MFHNQRSRLLRRENWTADDLAQELWAMFGPEVPLEHRGPITLVNDGENPAITFRNFGDSDAVFQVTRVENNLAGNTTTTNTTITSVSGGGGIPGEIISGSGNTYQVDIYRNGLSGSATRVSVRQLQIGSGETIPAGTWTMVSQLADGYYMQVNVWL